MEKLKDMKKGILIVLACFVAFISHAQTAAKFGYVDTDYILGQIPEYKAAQTELDKTSIQWQKEIEGKYTEIDKLYKAYQADAVLLTDDMKKKRENEIINKEQGHPCPPGIRGEFEWRDFITKQINITREKAEQDTPNNAHKPHEDVAPRVPVVIVFVRIFLARPKRFDGDHRREKRNGDHGRR